MSLNPLDIMKINFTPAYSPILNQILKPQNFVENVNLTVVLSNLLKL